MKSVTGLLKILNKGGLIYWSNKIGLQGISLKDYRAKSTSDGTNKHKQIQDYLELGIMFDEAPKLDKLLEGCKILGIEQSVNNGFINGRYDLYIEKDNKKIVIDFKSNSTVYLEHKIQLSTYKEMLNADAIAIIDFNDWEFKIIDIDTQRYFQIIKHLYKISEITDSLGERL